MKKKLIASAVSLAMALVMLTSASFAWFTVSTAPDVTEIKVTMTATQNLEIARATGGFSEEDEPEEVTVGDATTGDTTWGATITGFEGEVDFPATIPTEGDTEDMVSTISYDANGRVNSDYTAATAPESLTAGVGYYTADITYGGTAILEDAKVAAVFGVWLRSNVDCKGDGAVTVEVTDADDEPITDSTWAIILADAEGEPLTDNEVELDANKATAVQVIIYADGEVVVAEDVAEDLEIEDIKLTFSSSAVDTFATQRGGGSGTGGGGGPETPSGG